MSPSAASLQINAHFSKAIALQFSRVSRSCIVNEMAKDNEIVFRNSTAVADHVDHGSTCASLYVVFKANDKLFLIRSNWPGTPMAPLLGRSEGVWGLSSASNAGQSDSSAHGKARHLFKFIEEFDKPS